MFEAHALFRDSSLFSFFFAPFFFKVCVELTEFDLLLQM